METVHLTETWALRYPPIRDHTDGPTLTHTIHGIQGHPNYAVPWTGPGVGISYPPPPTAAYGYAGYPHLVAPAPATYATPAPGTVRYVTPSQERLDATYARMQALVDNLPLSSVFPQAPLTAEQVMAKRKEAHAAAGGDYYYPAGIAVLLVLIFALTHELLTAFVRRPLRRRVAAWRRTQHTGPVASTRRRPAA